MRLWSINKVMRAVNLWRDGLTICEIADRLGVTETDIVAHLPEMERFGLQKLVD